VILPYFVATVALASTETAGTTGFAIAAATGAVIVATTSDAVDAASEIATGAAAVMGLGRAMIKPFAAAADAAAFYTLSLADTAAAYTAENVAAVTAALGMPW
jgi:hypothetical protein